MSPLGPTGKVADLQLSTGMEAEWTARVNDGPGDKLFYHIGGSLELTNTYCASSQFSTDFNTSMEQTFFASTTADGSHLSYVEVLLNSADSIDQSA